MKKYVIIKPFADVTNNKKIVSKPSDLKKLSEKREKELILGGYIKIEEEKEKEPESE